MTILGALGIIAILGQEYVRPWVAEKVYAGEYMRLVFECDSAMHEEAALRQQLDDASRSKLLSLSADVGMMICHDYDKLRKTMLMHGVSEDNLAMLGLNVLEIEQITVSKMVDAHRMDRF
ncbi:TIGR03982 family His-Xaa-Ser system protein [Marinobacter sp.]|uniref:TIGR03982 family His-Xaa-Ser system protein n=1 Tax=Marinobacter sp. TaxID=50741 RepID=UPI003A953984